MRGYVNEIRRYDDDRDMPNRLEESAKMDRRIPRVRPSAGRRRRVTISSKVTYSDTRVRFRWRGMRARHTRPTFPRRRRNGFFFFLYRFFVITIVARYGTLGEVIRTCFFKPENTNSPVHTSSKVYDFLLIQTTRNKIKKLSLVKIKRNKNTIRLGIKKTRIRI